MTANITKAIKIARERVRLIHYATDDFVVQTFDGRNTRESHHMDRARAQAWAKGERIYAALSHLGIDDAGGEASVLSQEEGRWDAIVRHFAAYIGDAK